MKFNEFDLVVSVDADPGHALARARVLVPQLDRSVTDARAETNSIRIFGIVIFN